MGEYKVQIDLLTRYVKSSRGFHPSLGLCAECNLNGYNYRTTTNEMFESWDEFSGDYDHPVKSPVEYATCYEYYNSCRRMHDRRTKYGKARLSLAKHCLKYLQDLENKNG